MSESAAQSLSHRAVIVGTVRSFYIEYAVVALLELSVRVYDHRRDYILVADVRYIVRLNSLRKLADAEKLAEPYKALVLALTLKAILPCRLCGILRRHIAEGSSLSTFGKFHGYLMLFVNRKIFRQKRRILGQKRKIEHYFARQVARAVVVIGDERNYVISRCGILRRENEFLFIYQCTLAYREYRKRTLGFCYMNCKNVAINLGIGYDLLSVR